MLKPKPNSCINRKGSNLTGYSIFRLQHVRHFGHPRILRDIEDISASNNRQHRRTWGREARLARETTSHYWGRAVTGSFLIASPPALRLALVRAQRTVALEPLQLVLRGQASHRRSIKDTLPLPTADELRGVRADHPPREKHR